MNFDRREVGVMSNEVAGSALFCRRMSSFHARW